MTAATRHRIDTLIATDIAARGIDVDCISHVVNFDLPHVPEDYVHRIGRTARAGQQGDAISLVAPEERSQLAAIERLVGKPIRCEHVAGFTPAASAVENHPAQPPKSAAGRPCPPCRPPRRRLGAPPRPCRQRAIGDTPDAAVHRTGDTHADVARCAAGSRDGGRAAPGAMCCYGRRGNANTLILQAWSS